MENSKHGEARELITMINNSLANNRTRNFGLELLQTLLPYWSNDILIENILHWTSYCIVQHKEDTLKELKLYTLAKIVENSSDVEIFNKKFATEYLSAILRTCLVYRCNEEQLAALNCLMQCMKKYPNWFGNHKQKIKSFLIESVDSSCELVTETAAATFVCFLETGAAGLNGINYVANFNNEFRRICATIHNLYNNFLNEITEECDNSVKINEDVLEFKKLASDSPTFVSSLDITANRIIRCLILMKFLIVKKFSVEKRIDAKHLLDVLCRGLSVHVCSSTSAILSSADHSTYLKKIQLHLLSVFRAYIKRFYTTLIPFSVVVENIFLKILRRFDQCHCFVVDMFLKATVYKALNNWLSASNTINNELQFQEKLINIIVKDITSPRESILLNVKDSNNENTDYRSLIFMNKEIVCIHALDALKCFLSSSFSVDRNLLKEVVLLIMGTLNNPQDDTFAIASKSVLYQVKLYELLISVIKIGHSDILPSAHFIINLLNKGVTNQHWKISQISKMGLDILEKISQPLCPCLHMGSMPAIQDTHLLNNLLDTGCQTSQVSKSHFNKEIKILSNILINTSNVTMEVAPEDNVVINTEITEHIEEPRQIEDTILLNSIEAVKESDVNPEGKAADVALEKMFCSFHDVLQE